MRRTKTPQPQPEIDAKKTYEFHVPPGVSVATVLRVINALLEQGLLPGEARDYVVIPLVSSRHMYHEQHKDKR